MIFELLLIAIVITLGFYLQRSFNLIQKFKQKRLILGRHLKRQIKNQYRIKKEFTALQKEFSHTVLNDPLTGLPGRKIFEDHLELTVNQSIRHQLTCSVMFLDLDGFKIINDALGYEAGDELLKEISDRLKTCVRQVDTLSRFMGDEFIFIFSQIAKAETAAYIAQRLLDAISEPFIVEGQELYLTASIGIAVFPMDGKDGKTLLKNADIALSQAKLRGRNTYQFYQKEMHEMSRRELILSSSLHNETSYQNFNILYQPRINVETRQIVCMEAILQWQNPNFGLVTFEEFSRLAEKNNNIIAIYEWWLRNTCHDLLKWQEYSFYPEAISLQVSLKQLENTHFIQKVSAVLQETKINSASLIFEIIEPSLLTRIDLVEKMLHMLKHLGVQIAINNFGASHLQLQHLRRLPIDIFKIDHALVDDLDSNPESQAIVKMIIALAEGLQARVVAEGVKNNQQKNALLSLGCIVMQGNLFSQPVLSSDFNEKVLQSIRESTYT
ncbi:MAG TPA: EAL domain-containing protein [Gammaproteobacteria bacterium]|nr:EAL domain-containing protein [Gammaproteobacteria bacterium]